MKNALALTLLFFTLSIICVSAHPVATVTASVPGAKLFGLFGNPQVKLGQYIEVTVGITNTGNVPFKPKLSIVILNPDNVRVFEKTITTNNQIYPGGYNTFTVKTGIQANKVGTWTCIVTLYDSVGHKLDSKTQNFQVVASRAKITAINILGYIGATTAILGAVLLLTRRYFG